MYTFTLLFFAFSWMQPLWPYEHALHSSLTVISLALLWHYANKHTLNNHEFFLICFFIIMHCIAARWLYSNVPYDSWLKNLTGFSIQQTMGWKRNHFDRLIHFLYGLCLTPALFQHFKRLYTANLRHAMLFAICFIMISSLFYEWFEWMISLILSDKDTESYNGQQGDMWDAHKDMLLATIGALIWIPFYSKAKQNNHV